MDVAAPLVVSAPRGMCAHVPGGRALATRRTAVMCRVLAVGAGPIMARRMGESGGCRERERNHREVDTSRRET